MRIAQLVIVNGYGCNLDSPLKPYLDGVAAFLDANPSCAVFCGGRTQEKSFPGMSEAAVMAGYVVSQVPDLVFELEDKSYTTYESIRNVAARVCANGWEPDRILIFCEATRALRVSMLARRFFGFPPARGKQPIAIRTSSWELQHPTRELVATMKDWLAIRIPFINEIESCHRRRMSALR